nr:TMV resistance protein N-like [Quercus suber]
MAHLLLVLGVTHLGLVLMDLGVMDLGLVVVLDDFGGGNSGSMVVDLGYCGAEANACDTIWLPRNFNCFESETQFIEKIIKKISSTTSNRTQLFVDKYEVGIDSCVEEIELLLDTKSNGVRMLGIYGLGGVGKTIIAKAVYNKIFDRFDRSCFLEDVREKSQINNGIIQLQETLLSKILQDPYLKVDSVPQGTELIMDRFCHTRLLLILDDVDKSNQIDKFLGSYDWFSSGSRIIITTRDKQVLTTLGKDRLVYEIKELDQREAYELFSLHAFQMNKPGEEYLEVAKQIIHYANGLPLALKVIGSDLCGTSIHEWKDALEKHKQIPHQDIQERLKISYDGLEKTEKDIFLHVACVFKGFKKNFVTDVLETCNLCPRYGIRKLINKCLVTVDQYGILLMHDLLQQMGREIVQQESENPENRSRIWCYEDAYEVLTGNMGTGKIQAMILCSPEPVTMKLQEFPKLCAPNLETLDLSSCGELVTVHELCAPNLVELILECCYKLVTVHESVGSLDRLQFWHLRNCVSLQNLPNNLRLKSLESFDLYGCSKIEKFPNILHQEMKRLKRLFLSRSGIREVPSSIGYLTQLTGLWLGGCHNLRDLPDSIYKLQMLEDFSFGGAKLRPPCNSFDGLSEYGFLRLWELGFSGYCGIELEFLMKPNYFPVLSRLGLSGTDIVSIPESLNRFTTLETLHIDNCQQLRQIFGLPPFIKILLASHCRSLDAQSSSRLLNQIEEIICEGERSDIFVDPPTLLSLDDINDRRCFMVPYTEIPRWLNSKHQSVGNSISFHVGCKFPTVFAVYFAFGLGPQLSSYSVYLNVYLSINRFEKVEITCFILNCDSDDTLGISSRSHLKLQKLLDESNPSDYNHVEVTYEWAKETDRNNPPCEIRRWGVKVECICCPQISSISSSMALTLVDNDSDSDLNLPLKKRRKY